MKHVLKYVRYALMRERVCLVGYRYVYLLLGIQDVPTKLSLKIAPLFQLALYFLTLKKCPKVYTVCTTYFSGTSCKYVACKISEKLVAPPAISKGRVGGVGEKNLA